MVIRMGLDDRALPLTRGQLDIWLAHESGHSGTEWQLGLLIRVEGTVKRDVLERAIRQALQEAEPARAAFFEVDGQVFQKAIDYSDVELEFHDLSGSDNAVQEVREMASSIQRTPMPFTGRLLKFELFRTQPWLPAASLRDFAVVHPGTRWQRKRWPLDRWIELTRRLLDGV